MRSLRRLANPQSVSIIATTYRARPTCQEWRCSTPTSSDSVRRRRRSWILSTVISLSVHGKRWRMRGGRRILIRVLLACSPDAAWVATSISMSAATVNLVDQVGMFLLRHTGNDKDFLATRASFSFDLQGPSVNVQTACSTSLGSGALCLPKPTQRRMRHGSCRRGDYRAAAPTRVHISMTVKSFHPMGTAAHLTIGPPARSSAAV